MRPFVIRTLAFIALQAAIFVAVWRACPRRDDHYAAATRDKRIHLATAASPRVVFVGGSSVSFGFDSRVFAGTDYTPVNMGHNRSLGLSFMLRQAAAGMNKGDVVVVSPEYELLWGEPVDAALVTHLEHDPQSAAYVDIRTGQRLCDAGLSWIAGKLRCALHQVSTDPVLLFSRASFDDSGDFVAHRGKPRRGGAPLVTQWPEPDAVDIDDALAELEAFAQTCREVEARCVLAFAPLRASVYADNRALVDGVAERVMAAAVLPVVLTARQARYPDDAFFDAGPHLTESAARNRTQRLAEQLGISTPPTDF